MVSYVFCLPVSLCVCVLGWFSFLRTANWLTIYKPISSKGSRVAANKRKHSRGESGRGKKTNKKCKCDLRWLLCGIELPFWQPSVRLGQIKNKKIGLRKNQQTATRKRVGRNKANYTSVINKQAKIRGCLMIAVLVVVHSLLTLHCLTGEERRLQQQNKKERECPT